MHQNKQQQDIKYLDKDNYPTEAAEQALLEANPYKINPTDTMNFMRGLWEESKNNWKEEITKKGVKFTLKVGKSPINHCLIASLQKNKHQFWTLFWRKSQPKGKHTLLIPKTKLRGPKGKPILLPRSIPKEGKEVYPIMKRISILETQRCLYKTLVKNGQKEIAELEVSNYWLRKEVESLNNELKSLREKRAS
jgi:hypothetical protein